MKMVVILDDALADEVKKIAAAVGESHDTILRMTIRAGLPRLANCFEAPRPEGYFTNDYPLPDDRLALENAMLQNPQTPER